MRRWFDCARMDAASIYTGGVDWRDLTSRNSGVKTALARSEWGWVIGFFVFGGLPGRRYGCANAPGEQNRTGAVLLPLGKRNLLITCNKNYTSFPILTTSLRLDLERAKPSSNLAQSIRTLKGAQESQQYASGAANVCVKQIPPLSLPAHSNASIKAADCHRVCRTRDYPSSAY
jgi:hypothetical protein